MPLDEDLVALWKNGFPIPRFLGDRADDLKDAFSTIPTTADRRKRWLAISGGAVIAVVAVLLLSLTVVPLFRSHSPSPSTDEFTNLPTIPSTSPAHKAGASYAAEQDAIPPAINHFESFTSSPTCKISSLDMFVPTKPVCEDKESLLRAMMSGGRVGIDAPYQPRDCDMQWFSTAQICNILSRFSRVMFIGDSLARNINIVTNIFVRQDLLRGGARSWLPLLSPLLNLVKGLDCDCEGITTITNCSWWMGINDSADVYNSDPDSMACERDATARVSFNFVTSYPIDKGQLDFMKRDFPRKKPEKPIAVVLSHGLWNAMEINTTKPWLDSVLEGIYASAPWFRHYPDVDASSAVYTAPPPPSLVEVPVPSSFRPPLLFLTPNAATDRKLVQYYQTQNNFRLSLLEKHVAQMMAGSGIDHLGMYNMSIQASSWDGTHASLRTDMLKWMMILNWLDKYDMNEWEGL